jgi:hypothetical protein
MYKRLCLLSLAALLLPACPGSGGSDDLAGDDLSVQDTAGNWDVVSDSGTCNDPDCMSGETRSLQCTPEGETYPNDSDGTCCTELTPITLCQEQMRDCATPYCWPTYDCQCDTVTSLVCAACGDNVCGIGENACNCPVDCEEPMPDFCSQDGGECSTAADQPTSDGCPSGGNPAEIPGCSDGQLCCQPVTGCVDEGQPVKDGPESCCDGLSEIPGASFNPETPTCENVFSGLVCTACGNGTCETDWENPCNCPDDCDAGSISCVASKTCPAEHFCRFPTGICDSGPIGQCTAMPQGCTDNEDPVCGCDGQTYSNECGAYAAGVSVAYAEACKPDCLTAGTIVTGDSEIPCCSGDFVPICSFEDGWCTCSTEGEQVCATCGDSQCESQENWCNCPADCPVDNICEQSGGLCFPASEEGIVDCPAETTPVWLVGCPEGQGCCLPEGFTCQVTADCDDFNPCTCDKCENGVCKNLPAGEAWPGCGGPPGCCIADADCVTDEPCMEGHCETMSCVFSEMPDC